MAVIPLVGRPGTRVGAGYFCNNYPIISGRTLSGASVTPVDTQYQSGSASPQSGGIIPGTLPSNPNGKGVTAHAGGTKAAAVQLDYGVSSLAVVATAADSVVLPYAFDGAVCFIENNGAAAAQVFGAGTDTINNVATGTGVSQALNTGAWYVGTGGFGDGRDAGNWRRVLSA